MDALSLEQNTCHQSNFSLSLHKRGDRFTVRDMPPVTAWDTVRRPLAGCFALLGFP
jgi:hypothetical protein